MLEANIFTMKGKNGDMILYRKLKYFPKYKWYKNTNLYLCPYLKYQNSSRLIK